MLSEIDRAEIALKELARVADLCCNQMQGRLQDDTHKLAFGVLQQISRTALIACQDIGRPLFNV